MNSGHAAALAIRSLLGLIFLVSGLNHFFPLIPLPPEPPRAISFFGALTATGYMWPLIRGTEIVAGALLLAGLLVPFALVIIAPVIVNIVALDLFLGPRNLPTSLFVASLEIVLVWQYRASFAPLFGTPRRPDPPA